MGYVPEKSAQRGLGLSGGTMRRRVLGVALPLAVGLLLRLWWVWHYGQVTYDSHVYGEFARNALEHHIYGYTNTTGRIPPANPTLIRLPGYPAFLALCFKLFGVENYTAVMLLQVVMDLWACLLMGGIAARLFNPRTGIAALWMAALCPFTANYVAVPLTEELTIFCIALAFYALVRWRESGAGLNRWIWGIGAALAWAVLLRPEQGMLAAAVVPAVFWIALRRGGAGNALRTAAAVSLLTVLPLVPWTIRNWRVFHVIQPLAPRFAVDPGQPNPYGFQRWYRTWAVEFASTVTTYWNYDGLPIEIADLPNRAFDSNAQYAETDAVITAYDVKSKTTPEVDARFDKIARERIAADPIRYYLVLPWARVLNMMFRPRTEMIPVPDEWWKLDTAGEWFALGYAVLNAAFFALAGWALRWRNLWQRNQIIVWSMLATIVMRVALLLTIDNSEPRYTLEFFPVLIVLGSAAVERLHSKRRSS